MANPCGDTRKRTECTRGRRCEIWIRCLLVCGVCLASVPCALTKFIADEDTVSLYPKGDINVRYGDDLEILCTAGRDSTAEDLSFTLSGKPLRFQVVNTTTIRLFEKKPNEHQRYTYYCKNNKTKRNVLASVLVASPPRPVTDFKCVSQNLDKLTCSWTTPDKIIFTNYTLAYVINEQASKPCQANIVENTLTKYCYWNTSSHPRYRQQEEKFHFLLESRNVFGTNEQRITIDHFSVVKPDPPFNLQNMSETPHSVVLHWNIPHNMVDLLPDGVEHKIEYQIAKKDDTSFFRRVNTTGLPAKNNTYRFNLTGLPYAHMQYGVRVYIKPNRAKSDKFWSEFTNVFFYTASERPQRPPDMIAGAFDQNNFENSRVLYIYWKQLEEYEEAGANFTYKVLVTQGARTQTLFPDKNKSLGYLYIDKATLEAMEVTVSSFNEKGSSVNSSHLYIPPERETRSLSLTSFTKLAYENGTYELSWVGMNNIDNYTLFWCHHNTTDICNGRINFTILDAGKNKHVINLPRDYRYQFAISANNGTRTSGMIWAKCDISKDGIAMYGFPIRFVDHDAPGKTFVKLKWSMDCTLKEGIITGYNISFCPVIGTSSLCDNSVGNIPPYIIENPKQMDVNITNLRPYTTYQFTMALYTIHGLKIIENTTVRITTLEDTPTSPRNVNISDVQNNSLLMSWDPPLHINGHISKIKYVIEDHGKKIRELKYEDRKMSNEVRRQVKLEGLNGFTNYSLTVRACNEGIGFCSDPTNITFLGTRIGYPSKLKSPLFKNSLLRWDPPDIPGGTVDQYQIKIVRDDKVEIVNTTELSYALTSCEGAVQNETYQVRAVNFDIDAYHGAIAVTNNVLLPTREQEDSDLLIFPGEWSDESTVLCKSRNNLFLFIIIMGVLAIIGFVCGLLKAYKKIRKMGDIKPEFPKGLFVPDKDISKYPFGGLYPSEKENKPTSDEMLLLPNAKSTSTSTDIKQSDNDNCGSSDHTDSTGLSDASQGPMDRQNSTSDDDSNSSLHLGVESEKAEKNAIHGENSSNVDSDSSRENSPYLHSLKKNPSGLVQPVVSPVTGYVAAPAPAKSPPTKTPAQPAGSSYVMAGLVPPILQDIPSGMSPPPTSGYVRPEVAQIIPPMSFPEMGPSPTKLLGPESLPKEPNLPTPTKHGADSSYIQLQSLEALPSLKSSVRNNVPLKPASSGYVSAGDIVINKHLKNIMSGTQLTEESAILDPAMSPDAYCRFSWSTDPANDNLHSLLANSPTINSSKN